ncbi:hypothetical protein D3C76_837370 [compost metagenome]
MRFGEQLGFDLIANIIAVADACHDDRRGGRQQQGRDLRRQAITDGQQNVLLERVAGIEIVFEDTNTDPADDVDHQHHNPGDGVTTDKLRGTVHRAVEIGLFRHLFTPISRLFLVNQPRIEVGVDRHLLAGHRIEGKARRDFRNTLSTFGDHHKVDNHQDDEYHKADDEIAADDDLSECLDNFTGSAFSLVTVQ